MGEYESFESRAENPTRWQSVINREQPPLVKGDPVAVALVIACFAVALCLFIGVVAWPVEGR